MITPRLMFLLLQNPEAHYGGGTASGTVAGATTDPTGQLFRFLLSTVPQWVQIAGIFIGGPIAAIVAWKIWQHRRNLWGWFLSRSRIYKITIVSAGGFVALIMGFVGLYNYNYVMHKNDFCQSCHLMDTAWNRFQVTAHKDLQCHACHRQPLIASSKEMFYWVFERRMAIPAHDKVPTAVCSECHARSNTDSARTNVMLTAGHVIHLKSDSSALKNVQCVTCHGRDFHMFNPNNATCEQSGCHAGLKVKLGAMSNAKFLHCTTCHAFRAQVPEGETVAEAKRAVAPKELGCAACHQMAEKVLTFDLAADPHQGSCGSCHDPHKQDAPRDAFKSCAAAQCHAAVDTKTAFHRGLGNHKLDDCGACHQAHSWKVKGTDCLACHKNIFTAPPGTPGLRGGDSVSIAPVAWVRAPARTTGGHARARRASSARRTAAFRTVAFAPARAPRSRSLPRTESSRPPQHTDTTFLHAPHKSLQCTQCHGTTTTHGALKFARPDGCLACHHGAQQKAQCTACHATTTMAPYPTAVTFHVSARPRDVTRTLGFSHARHVKLDCARCHAANDRRSVTTTCTSCHADHHQPDRDYAACHTDARTGHDRTAHDGCAACHATGRFQASAASRPLCLACHQDKRDHYAVRECSSCHVMPSHAFTRAGGGP